MPRREHGNDEGHEAEQAEEPRRERAGERKQHEHPAEQQAEREAAQCDAVATQAVVMRCGRGAHRPIVAPRPDRPVP